MTHHRLSLALLLLLAACGTSSSPESTEGDAGIPNGSGPDASVAADASTPDADGGAVDWSVNGHLLTAQEQAAVLVIAKDVVPHLEGDREARLTFAARGAWWALKEGTWEQPLAAVYGYSNCNSTTGDSAIGPTAICGAGRAWQVGIAAVQVPGHTVTELEALAPKLYPGITPAALLGDSAVKAGVTTKATADAIVTSTGMLRVSWLLRVPAIGFAALVPQEVIAECLTDSKSWCFGTTWDETKKFAPTKAAAMVSMTDLHRILASLAP
jgi:hypothetical protein